MQNTEQVVLFSDPNFLSLNILQDLLTGGYSVNIISSQRKAWEERAKNVEGRTNILITSLKDYSRLANFSFAIFVGGFVKKNSTLPDFKRFISNRHFGNAKTLAIFPLETYSVTKTKSILISKNAGIIYLGDLLGPGIDLNSGLLLPSLIKNMIEKRTLTLGVGELFSPILVNDASRSITEGLKSSTFYGKKLFLMGNRISSTEFWKQNIKYFPGLKIVYDTDFKTRIFPKDVELKRLNSDLSLLLNITYRWLIKDKYSQKRTVNSKKKYKIRIPPRFKLLRPVAVSLLCILIFPLVTILISLSTLYFSYRNFVYSKGNLADKIQSSQKTALLAKTVFVLSKEESNILTYIPGLGKIYSETKYISYLGENATDIYINMLPVVSSFESIINNILGNQVYDVSAPALQVKSGLDYAYQKLSLFQIETKEMAGKNVLGAKQVLNLVDFDKYKNMLQQGSVLANNLPKMLGASDKTSYLTLFQNNMELRPTGGFIGSYGIADFGGGKLNGLTVNDIYSADGQLKGHVEPPEPIKKYLGEGNWYFRDSNWNPDFAVSAGRAEWFLNKEMEQSVDGTIAIDLNPIKKILNYTGPIFLPDYNLTVTAENLYEKTQQESQANFFAGSRKKASFLTALSRVLIGKISQVDSKQKIGILRSLYRGLEERSIQIHLNEKKLQDPIDKLAWNGSISTYSCGTECYSDFFADVEANLGVNKSNYFITRKLNLGVSIDKNKVTRNLNMNLTNSANPSLGESGQYKVYLRVLIPEDARLLGAKVINGQSEENLNIETVQVNGRQEMGTYIEILPGDSKTVNFGWVSNISSNKISSYGLFVRKQAGTGSDPLSVQIDSSGATLTKEGTSTYNTDLSKDFFARVSFKK